MTPLRDSRVTPAWILASGMALVGLGLVSEPQETPSEDSPQTRGIPAAPAYGTADSNDRMIAVTGVDVTGGSLLFLIDTESRHLSVYQAQGGTVSTSSVRWVGGRNIDLDLKVDGFNDRSEYSYKELAKRFDQRGASATDKH
jgi:hypothetical protein